MKRRRRSCRKNELSNQKRMQTYLMLTKDGLECGPKHLQSAECQCEACINLRLDTSIDYALAIGRFAIATAKHKQEQNPYFQPPKPMEITEDSPLLNDLHAIGGATWKVVIHWCCARCGTHKETMMPNKPWQVSLCNPYEGRIWFTKMHGSQVPKCQMCSYPLQVLDAYCGAFLVMGDPDQKSSIETHALETYTIGVQIQDYL